MSKTLSLKLNPESYRKTSFLISHKWAISDKGKRRRMGGKRGMKGKMKGWWQLHGWGWRCRGTERGSSRRESIVLKTILQAVRVFLINKLTSMGKTGEHVYTGLTARLTRRVEACLLYNMFSYCSLWSRGEIDGCRGGGKGRKGRQGWK